MSLLLWGKRLNPEDYPIRSDKEELVGLIQNIKENMIPAFLQNKTGFQAFIKNGIWLSESEYRLINKRLPKNWIELSNFFNNKNHMIYKSLTYREKGTKDTKKRQEYVRDLEAYISYLEKNLIYKFTRQE
jgi:hypothetical protein